MDRLKDGVNRKVLNKGKSIIRPNVRFVLEDKKVLD
jgi:hypothetical protein